LLGSSPNSGKRVERRAVTLSRQLGPFRGRIHSSHPRQRAQRREASREPTEIRELPELSESAARDEKISSAMSCLASRRWLFYEKGLFVKGHRGGSWFSSDGRPACTILLFALAQQRRSARCKLVSVPWFVDWCCQTDRRPRMGSRASSQSPGTRVGGRSHCYVVRFWRDLH
jgi:hypothetical protein